jgi:hypothetical protein
VSDKAGGTPHRLQKTSISAPSNVLFSFGVGVNFNPLFNHFIWLSVKFRFERFIILG